MKSDSEKLKLSRSRNRELRAELKEAWARHDSLETKAAEARKEADRWRALLVTNGFNLQELLAAKVRLLSIVHSIDDLFEDSEEKEQGRIASLSAPCVARGQQ
jgi:multidrug resistance efflux pump